MTRTVGPLKDLRKVDGEPKTHSAAAAPEPARVRLITAVAVTVVVLAMNLAPGELGSTVNTARSARRRAVSAQVRPWFLTARRRLKSLLPLGRSRDSACDSLAMNGVTRRRLNPGADASGRPAGQKAALWVRRRR